jgi:hypothetical protein
MNNYKKIVFLFSFVFFLVKTCPLNSQNVQWAKGGNGGADESYSVANDASGNIFVTGAFASPNIVFGTTTLTNSGHDDVFLVKYDPLGNVLWARKAGGIADDDGYSVCTDPSGNVFVTGFFNSPTMTFGATVLNNAHGGTNDIFLAKYDANGNFLWAKSVGGTFDDYGYSVKSDTSGNVLITGTYGSTSITFGTTLLTNKGSSNIFLAKYDPVGNSLWAKSAGGIGNDTGWSLCLDASGDPIITGEFNSPLCNFGSVTLTDSSSTDVFIAKYDVSGNLRWAKSAGGSSSDHGNSISSDANNNVFIAGYFKSPKLTFGSNVLINNGIGSNDIFVAKYTSTGNVLWAKNAGGPGDDYGYSICTDSGSSAFICGHFNSSSMTFGSSTLFNGGSSNIFLAKFDPNGNVIFAKNDGGMGFDFGYSVSALNGNAYITGNFNSPSTTFGSTSLNNAGGSELFLVKYNDQTVGVRDLKLNQSAEVFPNPTDGKFHIMITDANSTISNILISNLLGQRILEMHLNTISTDIDISGNPQGIYFITVQLGEYIYSKKLVLK